MSEESTVIEEVQEAAADTTPEESAQSAPDAPNPAGDDDRKVWESLQREGAKDEDEADQPTETLEEAADETVAREDAKEEADEAQPDDAKITGDKQIAKYVEALKLKEGEVFDVALSALKRSGIFSDDELEQMHQSDKTAFVTKGLKLAKTQRDSDSYAAKLRDEARKVKPAESKPVAPASNLDEVKSLVSAKLKPLADTFDAETASTIEDALLAVVGQLSTAKETQLSDANKQLEQMRYEMVEMRLGNARRGLQDRYPELANDDVFQRVLDKYDVVVPSGKFKTVEDALSEAARWELGEKSTDEIKNRLLRSSAQRKAGQPRADTPKDSGRAMSAEDKERLEFNRLHKQHMGAYAD